MEYEEAKTSSGLLTPLPFIDFIRAFDCEHLALLPPTQKSEKASIYLYDGDRSLWVREANTHHMLQSPEFSFDHTNSLGFSDREFSIEKPIECRDVFFVLGIPYLKAMAPADSALPQFLEHALHTMDSSTSGGLECWPLWLRSHF